jgi:fatty-acyl-CoA synthase
VPENGAELTLEGVDAYCRGRLASFKIPRHLLVMEGYPMTSSGKVQKYLLREMARDELQLPLG